MPYDAKLAERLAGVLAGRKGLEEKKMFGGIGWMLNGNMCVGVYKDFLILRVGEVQAKALFQEAHIKPMDITGKPMKGWVMASPEAYKTDLKRLVETAIRFVQVLPPK